MRCWLAPLALLLTAALLIPADGQPAEKPNEPAKPNTLTPREITDGWLLLFDGETTFGWKIDGEAKVADGSLVLGGAKDTSATLTTQFGDFELSVEHRLEGRGHLNLEVSRAEGDVLMIEVISVINENSPKQQDWSYHKTRKDGKAVVTNTLRPDGIRLTSKSAFRSASGLVEIRAEARAGSKLTLRNLKLKPLGTKPLFNGKDLTGWKEFPGRKSKFTVTDQGELNVKDGPGDLQTEGQWADFVLQLDCISHGKHLNSGIFFRCLPGEYQQGYEAQIHNGYKDGDRTQPIDFGTGAIYRRQPARKVVSDDHVWFTMTVIAHDNHFATWVNGYQVTDWTDLRPAHKNARQGCTRAAGPISIQGHDPTTNLSFRNIRIAAMPKPAAKQEEAHR
jgi:hypothetical protein